MSLITRQIDTIVIHCSDSPNGRDDRAKDIDAWHVKRGFHRAGYYRVQKRFNTHLIAIGYHFVIDINGTVETCRHLNETGAHAVGHNARSIGICMIGNDRFTPEQWSALDRLVQQLLADIGNAVNAVKHVKIVGHYQFPDSRKTCPNFDVPAWLENRRIPQAKNVYLEAP